MSSVRCRTNDQEFDELLRNATRGLINWRPARKLTSLRRNTILLVNNMLTRGLILLLAALLLGLPLASVQAQAGGCCGSASEHGAKAGGTHHSNAALSKCCCGDPKACTCHLTEDETSPAPDAAPLSTNTDPRPGMTETHLAPQGSIVSQSYPATPLVRFTFARAPSSDIYVLNHNFLC